MTMRFSITAKYQATTWPPHPPANEYAQGKHNQRLNIRLKSRRHDIYNKTSEKSYDGLAFKHMVHFISTPPNWRGTTAPNSTYYLWRTPQHTAQRAAIKHTRWLDEPPAPIMIGGALTRLWRRKTQPVVEYTVDFLPDITAYDFAFFQITITATQPQVECF